MFHTRNIFTKDSCYHYVHFRDQAHFQNSIFVRLVRRRWFLTKTIVRVLRPWTIALFTMQPFHRLTLRTWIHPEMCHVSLSLSPAICNFAKQRLFEKYCACTVCFPRQWKVARSGISFRGIITRGSFSRGFPVLGESASVRWHSSAIRVNDAVVTSIRERSFPFTNSVSRGNDRLE